MSRSRINFRREPITQSNLAMEIDHLHRSISTLESGKTSSGGSIPTSSGSTGGGNGSININVRGESGKPIVAGLNTITFKSALTTVNYPLYRSAADSSGVTIQLNDVSRDQYGFVVLASDAGFLEYQATEIL